MTAPLPSPLPPGVTLHRGWVPGILGWVATEHGRYYEREWNFGPVFEAKVAAGLAEMMLRYDEAHDLILSASDAEGPLGAITIDGGGPDVARDGARLRWFILADRARGKGLGGLMMAEAMAFVRTSGFERAWLTTFRGLDTARRLYETHGFRLTHEAPDTTWGTRISEQRFDWIRSGP
jgi:GNAT superfamily N-acetyltransferase